ncbi:MAG: phosphotransferase [Aggregatilineales bacterium]
MADTDILQRVQALQFTDKNQAEHLLRTFIGDTFELDVQRVELRPLAVSLNSFNGFLWLANGERLFFKTHTELDSVVSEYYNAAVLAAAGYPVIQPVYASTEAGRQLLVYRAVEWPSVFDVAWNIECGDHTQEDSLISAQQRADEELLQIYLKTLEWQEADAAAKAPVHQLFHHRLTGGRFERFYGPLPGQSKQADQVILFPGGPRYMREVRQAVWEINGQRYDTTLDDLISQALLLLTPQQAGPSVVGHGDAHNGNLFFDASTQRLIYFDPAFAGRHNPLLDLAKPLFHNVFAMWMYFPLEKSRQTVVSLSVENDKWRLEHNYHLPSIRRAFLDSKIQNVLIPLLRKLKRLGWLRSDWQQYLKAALFCCPLLTMNLANGRRFPPEIGLLGLAMAVEMGGESLGQSSLIDAALSEARRELTLNVT